VIDDLERQRDFYRQQADELGARVLRLQEDQIRARRETRRSRTTTRLIRDSYQLVDSNVSLEEIDRRFLQIILDALMVSRVALLQYLPAQQRFVARQILGFPSSDLPDFILPELPPDYYFANSSSTPLPLLDCLRQAVGTPYFLWAFNSRAGLALLVGNAFEDQHLHRPFEADDRELIEASLSVFIDVTERKRANEELEARVIERTAELLTANRQLQCELAERRRAEEALQQSKERFRQVISSISDHIYATAVTDEGKFVNLYLSPHVEFLTGYPYEKFIADWSFWPTVVIHPDDRTAAKAQAERLASGQSSEMEYRLIRANGEVIWVRDSCRVEHDPSRRRKIVYGVISDISERKRVEEELAQARDQALEASRLKTELLAKVSHELRTPLGAILGFSEILELGIYGALCEKQKLTLAEIIDSTYYLTNMVNGLLDQAQLDAGKLKLNLSSFAPTDILTGTLSKLKVLADNKGLSLTAEIAVDMPAVLTGDLVRLQQILVNLTSNAIKFSQTGSIKIDLYRPNVDRWAIQVTDTGIGIPLEAQAHLFEPFMQVDGSITRKQAGTGLGLSIVKQLATLMGGEVTLESEVGRGSTFTVLLPLQSTR